MAGAPAAACAPKLIYVDLGVSWCNTLELYRRVVPAGRGSQPWVVVGFEASPLITPYAESCMKRLDAGLPAVSDEALGSLPPTGSSAELYEFAMQHPSLRDSCGHKTAPQEMAKHGLAKLKDCVFSHPELVRNLSVVLPRPTPQHNLSSTIAHQLERAAGACPRRRSRHFLVPAAAGARNGSLSFAGGVEQMFVGGAVPSYWRGGVGAYTAPNKTLSRWRVPEVDVVRWLLRFVREEDHLVLKVDIEGGEHFLLPALLAANASRLVDVLLWECHFGINVDRRPSSCWRLRERLQGSGMRVYHEPTTACASMRSKWDCWKPEPAHSRTPDTRTSRAPLLSAPEIVSQRRMATGHPRPRQRRRRRGGRGKRRRRGGGWSGVAGSELRRWRLGRLR